MKDLRCNGCGEFRTISDDLNFKNCPNCQSDNINICNVEVNKNEDKKNVETNKQVKEEKIEPLNEQSLEKKITIDNSKKKK